MRILVIGNDPSLWNEKSEAFQRIREYAGLFDEYHVVLMAGGPRPAGAGGEKLRSFGNMHLYSVASRTPFFRALAAARVAEEIAWEHRIDIIDAQDPSEAGFAAWLVSRKTGVPFRVQIHTDIMSPRYRRASWKERTRYLLARFVIPRARCVRVVSERIKKSLLQATSYKLQAKKITVLPIFTDVARFLSALPAPCPSGGFRMVAVGRFVEKEKNFSMLIDIMREFIRVCPEALLVLVGDGPDKKKYELQIRKLKLEKHVMIEPWRKDLPSFLKSFDAFLLPSNYEGWGRAAIEAMAAGLPVVMTDVGLAGEMIRNGENGLVVPVGDKKAFLDACGFLYENPERRKEFVEAAFETLHRLKQKTNEEYLRAYADAYKKCL